MHPLQSAEAQQARKIRQLGVITVGTPVPLLTGFRVVNHDRRKRFHASPVGGVLIVTLVMFTGGQALHERSHW